MHRRANDPAPFMYTVWFDAPQLTNSQSITPAWLFRLTANCLMLSNLQFDAIEFPPACQAVVPAELAGLSKMRLRSRLLAPVKNRVAEATATRIVGRFASVLVSVRVVS